jgi:hypothetical protein
VEAWSPSLAEQRPLLVTRLGFLRGEVRIYLRPLLAADPVYVLQLEEVAAFHDNLPRGAEVRISDRPSPGSFGWWLPSDEPHHEIRIHATGPGSGFFLGLARRSVYRIADESEAINWPG